MTIGQLAARTGPSVRTVRFSADAGVLPEAARSEAGYRLFGPEAVARGRLVRTLRELGVGLADVKRVVTDEASLADVAATHARALDAQIQTLRLQRAVLRAVARSTDPQELKRMTDLTTLTADERRRIVEDYLDAVFGDDPKRRRRRAEHRRARAARGPRSPPGSSSPICCATPTTSPPAGAWRSAPSRRDPSPTSPSSGSARRLASMRAPPFVAVWPPDSPEALTVIERLEALAPGVPEDRETVAERVEAFTDRRVARYWTLVGIVNGWPQAQTPTPEDMLATWEWYARALRAHA